MSERRRRLAAIRGVLVRTFLLNLLVCAVKIALGMFTGILAVTADGIHSLGDSLSNVAGWFGIRLADREPDERYPYGYDKFEAIATLVIAGIVTVTFYELVTTAVQRLMSGPQNVVVHPLVLAAIAGTMVVNWLVARYEHHKAHELGSELLHADAHETSSDLLVSGSLIVGVFLIGQGLWWVDGALTLGISFAVLRILWAIIKPAVRILADAQVVDSQRVHDVVMAVSGAKFCHAIRSRGHPEAFFLDLHLGVNPALAIEQAHDDVCHRVKEALRSAFPKLRSANIHIEPDTEAGRGRTNSVFRATDPYDHHEKRGC
ncbi:MAG TPA: cation diffusion facilitator family transporter [Candidatus Paceibacterota bacterium]|nr:cation diffusion facilitator family transporter [Candidatus Paceibacterota bacterium]